VILAGGCVDEIRTGERGNTHYIEEPADTPIIPIGILVGVLSWRVTGTCDV